MNNNKLSRRQLIQNAALLALGTTISNSLIAQPGKDPGEPETVFIPPGAGRKGKIAKSDIVFKLDKTQTSGQLGSYEMTIPPGQLGAPPHFHKSFDEICIVLEGAVHIMVEDEVTEVKKGGWHLRPRGKVHTFWNSGKENAKVIELCTPGGHESYMQELAGLFENGARPQPGALQNLAKKHDITFRFDKLEEVIKKYGVSL